MPLFMPQKGVISELPRKENLSKLNPEAVTHPFCSIWEFIFSFLTERGGCRGGRLGKEGLLKNGRDPYGRPVETGMIKVMGFR